MNKDVIVLGGLPDSLINFRGDLLSALVEKQLDVTAMSAPAPESVTVALADIGVDFCAFDVKRNGLNPMGDLKIFAQLLKTFRNYKPAKVLAYTIKPVIWGGIAARQTQTPFYALITGLGFAFQGDSLKRRILTKIVTTLYGLALSKAEAVIFQNADNAETFIQKGIVNRDKCHVVNGSGVKLEYFNKSDLPAASPVFLTIARLLGEKGLREYSQAASYVKKKYPDIVFQIVGPEDPSPDGIPIAEVNWWQQEGSIDYLGSTSDVRPYINDCHVFVLASYHEGMPRTVLEAMAIGRPILTTNVPGCKETVIEGENGFLVEKANVEQLAEKMTWFIENQQEWQRMADRSHELAKERYDVHKVNHELLKIMGLN